VSVPLWTAELARGFWQQAREPEPFPRSLRRAIARAVSLSIVLLPGLSVRAALKWLQNSGLVCEMPGEDRPLRACLVARGGHGVALIDGSDAENEQRFSIAHELAHFLRDYWSLRRRILLRLGAEALQVLDGERPPTTQERLHALLRDVPLGFHLHLMERDDEGRPVSAQVEQAEEDADRLAYELLAPAEHVLGNDCPRTKQELERKLREFYGLPSVQASRYAELLLPPLKTDPLLLRLRSVLQ
jgi:hypothetical protein